MEKIRIFYQLAILLENATMKEKYFIFKGKVRKLNQMIETICLNETNLSPSDIVQLANIAQSMPLYAELTQSYIFIDCMSKNAQHAIIVAEAFPELDNPLYTKTIIGKSVFESFEPGVFYSHREGKRSIIKHAINQEGRSVHQTVLPVKNAQNDIIAVLIQEKGIEHSDDIHLDESNLPIPTQVIDTVLSKDNYSLPIVSDILMEMFILTNHQNQLIYANPVGIKFIVEMSHTDQISQTKLTDLMPFLKDVYERNNDDVYVFERTIGKKSLIIKKIKLRQSENKLNTLLIIQDLTELKMKERELSMKSTMIQEIHHRVKNNLQTIASLLRLQMHQGIPEESYSPFEDTLNRIFSISAVYELILSNDESDSDSEQVNIIELTRKVCSKLVLNSPFHKIDLLIRTNNNIICTSQKKAVSISLIVNELVQNALKHAFNDRKEGEVIVEFICKDRIIQIHVIDNGVGIDELKPSLGLDIVRNLVENDLYGEFTFESATFGTHALISFNLSPEVEVYRETDSIS